MERRPARAKKRGRAGDGGEEEIGEARGGKVGEEEEKRTKIMKNNLAIDLWAYQKILI